MTRWGFNWFPAYRATGARVEYIAADWREVRIRLPLNRQTRNYVGTIFGGSMYGAVDPIYMIMLIKLLGAGYVVWDKSGTIRFRRPGRSTLRATFLLDDAELDALRALVAKEGKTEARYNIELKDSTGQVIATCEKVISVRRRDPAPGTRDTVAP